MKTSGRFGIGVRAAAGLMVAAGLLIAAMPASAVVLQDGSKDAESLPTGMEIHKRSIEASGGEEARKKITNRKTTAKFTTPTPGVVVDMVVYEATPGKRSVVVSYQGRQMYVMATNGTDAWQSQPGGQPELLEGKQKEQLLEDAQMGREEDPELRYESIETVGRTEYGGEPAYEVAVVSKQGTESTHYYSIESGLLIGRSNAARPDDGALETRVTLKDFREIDGVKIPFRSEIFFPSTGTTQVMTISEVKHNVEIEPNVFAVPDSLK